MTTTLYDLSVGSFIQSVEAVSGVMAKGRAFAQANDIDLDEIVTTRLRDDMLPFRFQIQSVQHHTTGSIDAIMSGKSSPPTKSDPQDYAALEAMIGEAAEQLKAVDKDALNEKSGQPVVFSMPGIELPFTAEDWVLSFSLPNLYFHAATAYDILRIRGVELSKRDFLGALKLNR